MFYTENPSEELVRNVSNAIQVNIKPLYKGDWDKFFDIPGLEIYSREDYKFDYVKDETIHNFVNKILNRDHLKELNKEAMEHLERKYGDYMYLFRDNLSKMGFSVMLLSNRMLWEDPELYTSKKIL